MLEKLSQFYFENKRSAFFFGLAGALNTFIYFLLFTILWYGMHVNHVVSITISYIVAATIYFFVNRNFAFKGQGIGLKYQTVRYFIVLFFNYLVTLAIVQLLMKLSFSPVVGVIMASFATAIIGYFAFKHWVFAKKNNTTNLVRE